MRANSTNGNSGKCANSNINTEKIEKPLPLAEMNIQEHSPDKILKTTQIEDAQPVQQTFGSGVLFKIKKGNPSNIMKNTLNSSGNVKDFSLMNRI
jgi:hypothetical protein